MDGVNGPCEVCSPNRALAEIPNPLLHSQNFGDLPQDESGFKGACIDFDTTSHMTWLAVQ
jgi:hypothetical protein